MSLLRSGILIGAALGVFMWLLRNLSKRQNSQNQYNNGNFDGSDISLCPICIQEFGASFDRKIITLPCKHKFHKECIGLVLSTEGCNQTTCPLCRREIPKSFVVSNKLREES